MQKSDEEPCDHLSNGTHGEDHEPTQENWEALISSLPVDKGWIARDLYQYQGFWLHSETLEGILASEQHFEAHDTDILLATTPKSGTTWLKALLFTLLNRAHYPPNSTQQQHPLLTTNPHELVPYLELKLFADPKHPPDLTSFSSPRLFSTHMPFSLLPNSVKKLDSSCKLVYLCRSPKDNFASSWHFANNLSPGTNSLEALFDKFCRGVSVCGPFWDHVLGYWKESLEMPQRVLFLKYEELKEQPILQLSRLATFLGCPFSPQEEGNGTVDQILKFCSFDQLSNLEVNRTGKLWTGGECRFLFRRGEVGDWKNCLTAEMADKLDLIIQQKLSGSGLKF